MEMSDQLYLQTKIATHRRRPPPGGDPSRRRLLTPAPNSPLSKLRRFARTGKVGFVAVSSMQTNVVTTSTVVDLLPEVSRKVASNNRDVQVGSGKRVLYATDQPEVAMYWATMGAHHTDITTDSGVCVHPHPTKPGWSIITFPSTWNHFQGHWGWGWVWPVVFEDHGFERSSFVPWLWETSERVSIARSEFRTRVDGRDLAVVPIPTQDNNTMRRMYGQQPMSSEPKPGDLPLRGDHAEDFDPLYACGASGGQLEVSPDGRVFILEKAVTPQDLLRLDPDRFVGLQSALSIW